MTNLYKELKNNHQNEVNSFPIFFAFSEDQFEEGMKTLRLKPYEKELICSVGMGGFILKADVEDYNNMFSRQDEEMKLSINDYETGENFIFDMFNYELSNHEYTYTYEIDDTISALGFTIEEIEADERLLRGLNRACNYQRENDN
jgi:hypothetical protein